MGAAAFNKELTWDTSAVTSMEGMFEGAAKFNNADQDTIKNWDTKKVTNMASMFKGAAVFNLALTEATPKWDTGEVTTMQDMFNGAATFNKDLTSWKDKLSKVANNIACGRVRLPWRRPISLARRLPPTSLAGYGLRASPNRIGAIRGGASRFCPLKGTGSPLQNTGENAPLLFLFFLFQQALFVQKKKKKKKKKS